MTWLKVVEVLNSVYELLKKHANKIYLFIIYLKDRKIRDQQKVIERLEEENKKTLDNVKKKEAQDKKTLETQNKINSIPKPIKKLSILFLFLICSCTTTKIITQTEYLRPTLPEFNYCSENGTPLSTEPLQYQADCASYYEAQIHIYNEWKTEFELTQK